MTINRNGFESADLDAPVVLPTLNLDFANSQSLDERITFTRGSIGTFVNKNGLVSIASTNQPRFDYDPFSGECKGLLIEESRTNIVLNSTTLSSHINTATTTNSTTETASPDGTFNAYKIIGNSGVRVRESIYTNSFTMNANTSYTASVFLKGTLNRRYVVIWFDNTGPGNAPVEGQYYGSSIFIDLLSGTSTNSSIVKMISYGNGWYRCYITATVGASNLTNVTFNVSLGSPNGFSDTGNPSQYKYVGDGTSGIYYWGPQVEAGAFPTSYIPTTTSSVTRSADVASMTGTNFSSWYNQTEGTILCNGIIGTNIPVQTGYATFYNSSTSGRDRISVRISNTILTSNGVLQNDYTNTPSTVSGIRVKVSTSYQTNKFIQYANGALVQTDNSIILPVAIDTMQIGKVEFNSSLYFNSSIARLTYYPKALSPAQLQYLTQ